MDRDVRWTIEEDEAGGWERRAAERVEGVELSGGRTKAPRVAPQSAGRMRKRIECNPVGRSKFLQTG